MKIVIICNKSENIAKYRMKLIEQLIKKDNEIICILSDDKYLKKIENKKIKCIIVKNDRLSLKLFENLKYLKNLINVLNKEKPDIVFSFTPKPIIIGSIAAKIAGIHKIRSMLTRNGIYIFK